MIKREGGKIFKMTDNRDIAYAEYTKETPISLVTGAPGTISTLIGKYPYNIPVNHDTKELENTATMGTEHILLKVRMLQYKTFIMGNNSRPSWTTYCNHRTDVTTYTLKTWFVSISLWIQRIKKIYNNNNNIIIIIIKDNSQNNFKIQQFPNEIFRTVPSSNKDEVEHSGYFTI